MRSISLILVAQMIVWLLPADSSPFAHLTSQSQRVQQDDAHPPKLSLRLSTLNRMIHLGEDLELRMEIWNEGGNDVYVCKQFERMGWPLCSTDFTILDSAGQRGPQFNASSHADSRLKVPLASALIRDWIALSPHHFCGTTVKLDPTSYPLLRVPGDYRVMAEYSSQGLVESYRGALQFEPGEIERLPAKSWQGQIEAEPITITVLAPNR